MTAQLHLLPTDEPHDCRDCESWQANDHRRLSGTCTDPDIGGMTTMATGGGCRNHFRPRRGHGTH